MTKKPHKMDEWIHGISQKIDTQIINKETIKILYFFRKFYLSRGRLHVQAETGILSVPHISTYLSYCNHVMDIILD